MAKPENITILEALSFVYIACTNIDGEISDEEVKVVQTKILEWSPNGLELAKQSVQSAVEWYFDDKTNRLSDLKLCLAGIKAWGNPTNIIAIINDLEAIVNADGHVNEDEKVYLEFVKSYLI